MRLVWRERIGSKEVGERNEKKKEKVHTMFSP